MLPHLFRSCVVPIAAWALWLMAGTAVAQNDWQFPDPHFGAVQFGHGAAPASDRQYRAEIAAVPKPHPQASASPRPRRTRWGVRRR